LHTVSALKKRSSGFSTGELSAPQRLIMDPGTVTMYAHEALTVRGLYNVVSVYLSGNREGARRKLRKEFQTPGRIPILVSRGSGRGGGQQLERLIRRSTVAARTTTAVAATARFM